MSNLIDRQAAIDSLTLNAGWKDEEGRSVEDWDERKKIWTALINLIPSAQPEIIRCKDCEHYDEGLCRRWVYSHATAEDSFCSDADMRSATRLHITELEEQHEP